MIWQEDEQDYVFYVATLHALGLKWWQHVFICLSVFNLPTCICYFGIPNFIAKNIYCVTYTYMGQDLGEPSNVFLEVTEHICVTSIEINTAISILSIK